MPRSDWWRLLRFALVGGLNTAIDVAVFLLLDWLHPTGHLWWLGGLYSALGWLCASLAGWQMHSRFTFRAKLNLFGFYAVTLGTFSLQYALAAVATLIWGNSGALGGKAAAIILTSGLSYLGYRYLASGSPRSSIWTGP
jgi:putative flippase GtrA